MPSRHSDEQISRSRKNRDKARNERQKNVLLTELARINMTSFRVLEARSVRNITSALKTDARVGLTLAAIASQARDIARRQRNQRNARRAYDTVLQRLQGTPVSETDDADVKAQLTNLRAALEALGEAF